MGGSLVLDGLIFAFGQQALILIVVELSTDDFGLADFRAGQTLIGPLAALFPVLNMLLLPRLAQGYAGRRLLPLVSTVAVATALVYTTVLMLASGIVSQLLFNEQVRLSLTLICLAGVQVLSYSFVLGRVAVLRARHRMREILVSRTLSTVAGACVGFSYVLLPVPEILGASLAIQSVLFSAILLIITRTLNSKGAGQVHLKEGS
ncbi:hypothetical protein [Actinomycetospora sp. CA-084318]|uniref:hypothetical protein n=1 Tax=Actinomycetospora sp. CA-084318 TaxID=3239892 RepID=UPI003D971517